MSKYLKLYNMILDRGVTTPDVDRFEKWIISPATETEAEVSKYFKPYEVRALHCSATNEGLPIYS